MLQHALLFVTLAAALPAAEWDSKAAASYLDQRTTWWMSWPGAQRDQGTFCISCHTSGPYVFARPALRSLTRDTAPNAIETKIVANVAKRVQQWKEALPAYPDKPTDMHKTVESRGTESIWNALVLSAYQTPETKQAFDNMFEQQIMAGDNKGAWEWLQFHNSPWEGDSQFYGSVLAALAIGNMPADYRNQPAIQRSTDLLRQYLNKNKDRQTPMDRVMLVWASTKLPRLLPPAQQQAILKAALANQQPDGGISLGSLSPNWKRRDGTDIETKPDGYATGLVAYVMQLAGTPRGDKQLQAALNWLTANQEKSDGRWLAYSMNKQRDLSTEIGRFMADAATAYATLALTAAH